MIKSKYITAITAIGICITVLFCIYIVYMANHSETVKTVEYQNKLFGEEMLTIDIQVDDDDWKNLLDNAGIKEYISGDLVINGETFSTVGIRTKGNSSLTQVINSDSDKYSLEFKFNHYMEGQTCYGLDNFCVNNMFSDVTYMKDAIAYDIMEYIGVPTPLTNYANITVNGESWGFYLVLERYNKSFLDRVYDTSAGQLYNVKIQMGQREDFEGRSGGGSLVYTDDEIDSYGSIFDNAEFRKTSDQEKKRVIKAIKNLNEGTDLEKYIDVDEVLRYFAAHTVLVNLDSYISNMQQNYYIYERDGKLTILPWDYDLSFGGFQGGSATSTVNFPIDTPVSGVSMEDRPLINKLLEVEEYKEKYHEYLNQIVEGYFDSGVFASTVLTLESKITEFVKNDVSARHTYEQHTASLPILIELGTLRAQSIAGQLDGTIPSTTSGQSDNPNALIDASHINLSDLGSMGGGGQGGGFQRGGDQGDRPERQEGGFGGMGMDGRQFERPGDNQGGPQGNNVQGNNRPDMTQNPAVDMNVINENYAILLAVSIILLIAGIFFVARRKKRY